MACVTSRPCAAPGFTSYRYAGRYGFVMIGAHDDADALREAERSIEGPAAPERLEVWNAEAAAFVPAACAVALVRVNVSDHDGLSCLACNVTLAECYPDESDALARALAARDLLQGRTYAEGGGAAPSITLAPVFVLHPVQIDA